MVSSTWLKKKQEQEEETDGISGAPINRPSEASPEKKRHLDLFTRSIASNRRVPMNFLFPSQLFFKIALAWAHRRTLHTSWDPI